MFTIPHRGRNWAMADGFPYQFIDWYREAEDNIGAACARVTSFGLVIQAGGHVGVWPWLLAQRFARVLTFEPDPANFECAVVNLQDAAGSVRLSPMLLGDRIGTVPWHTDTDTGSHRVAKESVTTRDMITLDSLELPACDLICLDVEGYESFVLKGAAATIARYRPVIMVEWRGHEGHHGLPEYTTHYTLEDLGYRQVAKSHEDCVYLPPTS